MDRIERIAQLFVLGFEGTEPSAHILRMIREVGIGGVILFGRNIRDPLQTATLVQDLQAASRIPLFVCIDQEGGRVSRLSPHFTAFPPARLLGLSGSEELAYAWGRATARELSAVGVNLDFAPVLDLDTRPENPVIGDRSLGSDPEQVAKLGCAAIRGLQEGGIAACGKHFPGHGDTLVDSHLDLPRVDHDAERLSRTEIHPFRKAVAAGVEAVMTAHVLYTALDPRLPATLSPAVLQDILRRDLDFQGLIVTDDLEMQALAKDWGVERSCLLALEAGADLLLICHDPGKQEGALRAVAQAVRKGALAPERIEASVRRVLDLKERRLSAAFRPDPLHIQAEVGSPEHRELAARIAALQA